MVVSPSLVLLAFSRGARQNTGGGELFHDRKLSRQSPRFPIWDKPALATVIGHHQPQFSPAAFFLSKLRFGANEAFFFLESSNASFISLSLFTVTMVDRRSDPEDGSRAKRQKMNKTETDPKDNPYLAHMYADETSNGDSHSWDDGMLEKNPAFAKLKRHRTTAALAKDVEDSEINPFNGQPFSSKYLSILHARRDLPVHAQR